ncbi:hypothetical protein HN747_00485 [archaeon]|nr:hypothetical protein [archaeon]
METEEIIILSLAVIAFLKFAIYDPVMTYWYNGQTVTEKIMAITGSLGFQVTVGIIIFILLIVSLIRFKINLSIRKAERLGKLARLSQEKDFILELSKRDIEEYNSKQLEKFIKQLEKLNISEEIIDDYDYKIKKKLVYSMNALDRELYSEELYRYQVQKEKLIDETKKLKDENYDATIRHENKKKLILKRLDIEENYIYEDKDLREEEKEVLRKNDFEETNEYDPIENKYLTFFVKKILNHSATHSFLVERIKQILEQHISSNKIRRHDTRDADLTFQVNHKIYALEVETGSGLTKKKKLEEKVALLNNKYGQNWYIVVSNRDLAKKYREYGKVVPRKGVCKIIENLAQN